MALNSNYQRPGVIYYDVGGRKYAVQAEHTGSFARALMAAQETPEYREALAAEEDARARRVAILHGAADSHLQHEKRSAQAGTQSPNSLIRSQMPLATAKQENRRDSYAR